MQKNNLDEMTNLLLNNEYKLHEDEEIEEKRNNLRSKENHINKKKKTKKPKIMTLLKVLIVFIIWALIFIYLFFKTSLFQKYKELWVETAMSTMNHQFLAKWFLSDDEINEILKKLEVQNNENSNSDNVIIQEALKQEEKNITVEK